MVSHSHSVGTEEYKSEITIQEDGNECVIITLDFENSRSESYLTIQQLHDYIGTLLHVQQKLKNK